MARLKSKAGEAVDFATQSVFGSKRGLHRKVNELSKELVWLSRMLTRRYKGEDAEEPSVELP